MNEIDEHAARRVLEVVDAGLVRGVGEPVPGQMCVEAAVCYALGLPHSDEPPCVAPAVRWLSIRLNDARWSSPQARARGLRRLAIASLGSAGALDEGEFSRRAARLAIQTCVPTALRAVAQRRAGEQRGRLLHAAELCEQAPTREHALKARAAVASAAAAAAAADAAAAAADAYYAAVGDAYYAAYADAAAAAAADAAAAAADAYYAAVGAADAHLSDFAERVVQILCDMGAPGCAFLHLAEVA